MDKDGDKDLAGRGVDRAPEPEPERKRAGTVRCPSCKKPTVTKWRPFCSRRCADVDLNGWLSGRYVIAGGSVDEDEDGAPSRAEIEGLKPD